jgi:membrane fusion protein, peptide pheromone/bacteriocin exporter
MPSNKAFPKVNPEYTTEYQVAQHSKSTKIVYLTIISTLLAILISLPFITTSVSVKSLALIRPATEITSIRSLASGRLKESFVRENQTVEKGETLYTIESDILNEKEEYTTTKIKDIKILIEDLQNTLQPNPQPKALITPLYQQAWFSYKQKIVESTTLFNKSKADYNRNLKLHQQKVIADAEFESFQFELDKANNELELLKQNQLGVWQNELRNYEKELQDFETQLIQIVKEKENLIIKAPVSGNIQNLTGVYTGSIIFTNQDLAQISPDTTLLVESYITPNDIGMIRAAMPVRFQVDAFNYNQWGLATGKVLEISNDVHIINDKPVFKVKCALDEDYLQLKNGYKGYLKKGMTLQARFTITERTLWQLLYDNVDDWLNPNTFTN